MIQPASYQIDWSPSMHEIVPEVMTTPELILYWVIEIILYIPRLIINAIIDCHFIPFPNTVELRESGAFYFQRNNMEQIHMPITLPNNKVIHAYFHRHKKATEDTPTILRFPGLGERQDFAPLEDLTDTNAVLNFVTFDYPGFRNSERTWNLSKQNCILSALAVYEFTRQKLHIPEDKIHFWAMSLGGAIALEVKKNLPNHEGIIFCDRTFSSTHSWFCDRYGNFLGTLAQSLIWSLNQSLSSTSILSSLEKGKIRVLNLDSPFADEIIPAACDLLHAKVENPSIDLRYIPLAAVREQNCHNVPLSYLHLKESPHTSAPQFIVQEILASSAHS